MQPLIKALGSGYTPKQILNFFLKKFPDKGEKIKSALAAGYTAEQIISYLTKGQYQPEQQESNQGQTLFERTRNLDIQKANQRSSTALKGAALAAGAAVAPTAISALQRAIPYELQSLAPGMIQASLGQSQSPSPIAENLTTNTQQQQQQDQSQNTTFLTKSINDNTINNQTKQIIKKPEYVTALDMLGIRDRLERLRLQGKSPEIIKAAAKKMISRDQFQELEETRPGYFDNLIDTFIREEPTMQVLNKETRQPVDVKPLDMEEERPIEKGQDVITPSGVGKVVANRNGKAIVEIDGKKQQVDEKDIEQTSYTQEEIADAYDDLFSKIPEEYRSGFIQWAGYDEDRNVLGFIPRGGKYEELDNITPEEAELVKTGKGIARTTGETREGLWIMGEDTRGGIISQIIHDRKKRAKLNQSRQLELGLELPKPEKLDRGMKPIFDELEYARNLSKERDRRKKLEEKERKKRERDEAKKRKK